VFFTICIIVSFILLPSSPTILSIFSTLTDGVRICDFGHNNLHISRHMNKKSLEILLTVSESKVQLKGKNHRFDIVMYNYWFFSRRNMVLDLEIELDIVILRPLEYYSKNWLLSNAKTKNPSTIIYFVIHRLYKEKKMTKKPPIHIMSDSAVSYDLFSCNLCRISGVN